MSIRKYENFVKIVECGSITAAAAERGYSQSAATQLLNALEADLSVRLLKRNRNGIVLTSEGEKLLPLIKKTLEDDAKVVQTAASLSSANKHTLRIATFKSVAINWLPEILREFSHEEPDVDIELIDSNYNDIEETLSKVDVDLAFVPLPTFAGYTSFPLYTDRLLAVLPPLSLTPDILPDSEARCCPVSLFENAPVISLLPSIDRDARSVFEQSGIKANIRYRVEDDYAMLAMVEKGLGIAIVPELILKGYDHDVRILPLNPPASRTIGIAFPDYSKASPEALKFSDFSRKLL